MFDVLQGKGQVLVSGPPGVEIYLYVDWLIYAVSVVFSAMYRQSRYVDLWKIFNYWSIFAVSVLFLFGTRVPKIVIQARPTLGAKWAQSWSFAC